jgi:hypothetical protein
MAPYPKWIVENDLKSDLDVNLAFKITAQAIAPFLVSIASGGKESFEAMGADYLNPFVQAMVEEGYYSLKPACYSSDEINPKIPTCWQGSQFITTFASAQMANRESFKRPNTYVTGYDQFHRASTVYPYHHPLLNGNCSLDTKDKCDIQSVTVTENIYPSNNDFTDTKKFQVAATEMRVKLKSRQSMKIASGEKDADFHTNDEVGNRCAEINQFSLDWAIKITP